jgi:hypothetical protein
MVATFEGNLKSMDALRLMAASMAGECLTNWGKAGLDDAAREIAHLLQESDEVKKEVIPVKSCLIKIKQIYRDRFLSHSI